MAKDIDPNKPLGSLNFSHLIGSPLLACISAQEKAALMSHNYIEEVGLKPGRDGLKEATTVTFSFVQEGQMIDLKVPLLTLVPIPFFSIDTMEINFRASVKIEDGEIKATYTAGADSKGVDKSAYNVESAVDVHVKASQDDMPAGLSKVLGFLSSNIRTYSGMVEFPKDADEALVKLICEQTHADVYYEAGNKMQKIDLTQTKVRESDVVTLSKLTIDHNKTDFRNLKVLGMLPGLTDLRLTYDSAKVRTLDLTVMPQLRSIELRSPQRGGKSAGTTDVRIAGLKNLRHLLLQHVNDFDGKTLDLSDCELLETIELSHSPVKELNISGCRNLRILFSTNDSPIKVLVAWEGFKVSDYNIKNLTAIEYRP